MSKNRFPKYIYYLNFQHQNPLINYFFIKGAKSVANNLDDAYYALKCFFKYSLHLDAFNIISEEQNKRLTNWTKRLEEKKYAEIINEFNLLFYEKDYLDAKQYFIDHPDAEPYAGSEQKLMYSYLNTPQGVINRNKGELASGAFGKVTHSGSDEPLNELLLTKRQSSCVKDFALEDCQLEALYQEKLGIAYTGLVVRKKNDKVYKVYQVMYYLGEPILRQINDVPMTQKLEYAIQLLIMVDGLHSGRWYEPCAHRDIKPSNLVLNNKTGRVHLVDFGFVKNNDLTVTLISKVGTPEYFAVSFKDNIYKYTETPSSFFNDLIATLRTIYFPKEFLVGTGLKNNGILNQSEFNKLPKKIQKIVNTSDLVNKTLDNKLTAKMVAAVFIAYYKDTNISHKSIEDIICTIEKQDELINTFIYSYDAYKSSFSDKTLSYTHINTTASPSFQSIQLESEIEKAAPDENFSSSPHVFFNSKKTTTDQNIPVKINNSGQPTEKRSRPNLKCVIN